MNLYFEITPGVHPCDEKFTLWRNTTHLRRAGRELRSGYVRFAVALGTNYRGEFRHTVCFLLQ